MVNDDDVGADGDGADVGDENAAGAEDKTNHRQPRSGGQLDRRQTQRRIPRYRKSSMSRHLAVLAGVV